MPPAADAMNDDPADLPVDKHREVQLTIDIGALFDVDDVDGQSLRTGLMRHELGTEHAFRGFSDFVEAAGQLSRRLPCRGHRRAPVP